MSPRPVTGVYLTWNDSTRSKSLSRILGIPRRVFVANRHGALRHVLGTARTAAFLLRHRPRTVWFQYSLALACLLGIYRRIGRDVVVVADVHTKALRRLARPPLDGLIRALKRWSLQSCDAVVVTNPENATFGRDEFAVNPVVLADPLPQVPPGDGTGRPDRADVVFVCSYAEDEPLDLIAETVDRLAPGTSCAITGDPDRLGAATRTRLSKRARLTGFLSDDEYWRLLTRAGCVTVLSSEPACIPCGAYEALAAGHRPVVHDDRHTRSVFGDAATYVALRAVDLQQAIERTIAQPRPAGLAEAYEARWWRWWRASGFNPDS